MVTLHVHINCIFRNAWIAEVNGVEYMLWSTDGGSMGFSNVQEGKWTQNPSASMCTFYFLLHNHITLKHICYFATHASIPGTSFHSSWEAVGLKVGQLLYIPGTLTLILFCLFGFSRSATRTSKEQKESTYMHTLVQCFLNCMSQPNFRWAT